MHSGTCVEPLPFHSGIRTEHFRLRCVTRVKHCPLRSRNRRAFYSALRDRVFSSVFKDSHGACFCSFCDSCRRFSFTSGTRVEHGPLRSETHDEDLPFPFRDSREAFTVHPETRSSNFLCILGITWKAFCDSHGALHFAFFLSREAFALNSEDRVENSTLHF